MRCLKTKKAKKGSAEFEMRSETIVRIGLKTEEVKKLLRRLNVMKNIEGLNTKVVELKGRRLDCDKSKAKTVWKLSLVSFLAIVFGQKRCLKERDCFFVFVCVDWSFKRKIVSVVGTKECRHWLVVYTQER